MKRRARPPPGPPLRVVQLSDTHLYADPGTTLKDCNTEQSLARVLATCQRLDPNPDLVLLTGDLVHDGSADAYRRLARQVRMLAAPTCALAGNHDVPRVMRATFADTSIDCRESLLVGAWQFLFLDSSVPGREHGELGGEGLRRLEAHLDAHPETHALVCLHHPPLAVGSPWLDPMALHDADAFWAVVDDRTQVRGVLWGHIHQTFEGARGGVRLLGTPSTCIQFRPGTDHFALDDQAAGYRRLLLHPDGRIDTAVVRVGET